MELTRVRARTRSSAFDELRRDGGVGEQTQVVVLLVTLRVEGGNG